MRKLKIKVSLFTHINGPFKKRWWMRIVCWFKKHNYKKVTEYSIVYKQCKRCGKEVFNKKAKILEKALYKGEVGQLYGIRFIIPSLPPLKIVGKKPKGMREVKKIKWLKNDN